MAKNGSVKEEEIRNETSGIKLLFYDQPELEKSKIYYISHEDCYSKTTTYLESLENVEIQPFTMQNEIEYKCKKADSGEPFWTGKLEINPAEMGCSIKFRFDFKDYFRKNMLLGLKSSILVAIFLSVIVGSYNFINLTELWFIFTVSGLVGTILLFLGIFVLDRSIESQRLFINEYSNYLQSIELEIISDALEKFRSEHLPEKVLDELMKEKSCPNCKVLNKFDSKFCIKCGLSLEDKFAKCVICFLEIVEEDEIIRCPHCDNPAHKSHFLEWLKIKGFCPICKKRLTWKDGNLV